MNINGKSIERKVNESKSEAMERIAIELLNSGYPVEQIVRILEKIQEA